MNIKLLHKKLIQKKLTISVAESCTGGLLANNLTKLSNDNIISLLLDDFKFLLSLISECKDLYLVKSNQHAVDTSGPAHEPLPASSTPIIIIFFLYKSLSISELIINSLSEKVYALGV